MCRRQSESHRLGVHRVDERCTQRRRIVAVSGKQACAADGRVRHRAQKLGVVVESMLGVGVRPAPVEHEFTMRIMLEVERRGGDQAIAVVQAEVVGLPAVSQVGAAVFFESREERMREEWAVVAAQYVPLRRRNIPQATVEARFHDVRVR